MQLEPSAEPAGRRGCRVCGGADPAPALRVREHALARCRRCGFLQVTEPPSEESLTAMYGQQYFSRGKYGNHRALELENARRLALLRAHLPAGGRVLDAGCADGDFVSAAKGAFEISGLDRSEFAIEQARERNPELAGRLWCGKLEDLPAGAAPFDAICLWDVIEHVWDPVPVCRDLLARLAPGGVLLLSTPAADAPIARLMGRYWAFMTPPEHLGFFGRRTFEVLFAEAAPARMVHHERLGKWANVGFVFYKAARVLPRLVPSALVRAIQASALAGLTVYVPTADVQYVVVRVA